MSRKDEFAWKPEDEDLNRREKASVLCNRITFLSSTLLQLQLLVILDLWWTTCFLVTPLFMPWHVFRSTRELRAIYLAYAEDRVVLEQQLRESEHKEPEHKHAERTTTGVLSCRWHKPAAWALTPLWKYLLWDWFAVVTTLTCPWSWGTTDCFLYYMKL